MIPLDMLRLMIADVDPNRQVLTDDHLIGYLALNGIDSPHLDDPDVPPWRVRMAAADALDAIATSEALVGKVIRTQDLQTDGAKVATELRAQATGHRARAQTDREQVEDDASGGLTVLEFHPWR